MKQIKFIFIFCVISAFLIIINKQYQADDLLASSNIVSENVKKLYSIMNIIQKSYVDEVDEEEIFQDAVNGILGNLDPHSAFLTRQNYKKWTKEFEGFSGIGIRFTIFKDTITVTSVMEDCPASASGIQRGDKIIAIDGKIAVGANHSRAANLFSDDNADKIVLRIRKVHSDKVHDLELDRQNIIVKSIPYFFFIAEGTGYIKINLFSITTADELQLALDSLKQLGMERLVLDLRGNGGGYFSTAISVADKFLPEGKIIVTTRGRDESSFHEYYTTDQHKYLDIPMIVLVDHGTASSSEIVAAALQDWDRALILGEITFGKGLVQSQYALRDGSTLLITTARYFTPCGRSIQRKYKNFTRDEYYRDVYRNDAENQSSALTTRPGFRTPAGRTVFGGGGIIPDLTIYNTTILPDSLRKLVYDDNHFLFNFTNQYMETYSDVLDDVNQFIESYKVNDQMLKQFQNLVKNIDISYSYFPFNKFQEEIKFLIKRELAYLRWGKNARFKVHLTRDNQLKQGLAHFDEAAKLLARSQINDTRKTLKK